LITFYFLLDNFFLPRFIRLGDFFQEKFNAGFGRVVARNRKINFTDVVVRAAESDDRNTDTARLANGCNLSLGIYDKNGLRGSLHRCNSAEKRFQFLHLAINQKPLLFCVLAEFAFFLLREQCLHFFHSLANLRKVGQSAADKATGNKRLTNALGPDYACAMDANSVLKQKRDSAAASGDIARLEGKRLVVVSEIEKGSRLQESFMKQASGNDSLVARGLYQSEREFRPTHQFWFQTNYRPGFDATDSGNKRRYIEIPFDNDLTTDPLVNFDGKLKIRMRQDKDFLKAVLAWAVAGAVEWHQHKLQIPESVQTATAALFAHNDFLNDFLKEMCVVDPDEKVPVKSVWDAYKQWCEEQGEEPAQGRTFNHMMEERGFVRKQARVYGVSGKAWMGIRLKEHDELMAELPLEDEHQQEPPTAGNRSRQQVKQFPLQGQFKSVFNGGVRVESRVRS